jgi:hypothetical protein
MADPGKVAAVGILVDTDDGDGKVGASAMLVDADAPPGKVGSIAILVDAYVGTTSKGYFRLGKNLVATGVTT